MPDTILTSAIHTVVSQPTVALMRNEMGIGAAVLSGTNTGDDGTVTTVSVVSANGFSGTVANAGTTPAITIIAGAITPDSVASAGAISGTTGGFTGVVTVPAGTAGAPAIISTTGTADTGIFFPAADTWALSTAGSERMRILSTGNVGFGTTSPLSNLSVGPYSFGPAVFSNTATNQIEVGTATNNGEVAYSLSVGEGTNNPRVKFFLNEATMTYGFDTSASINAGYSDFHVKRENVSHLTVIGNSGTGTVGNVGIGTETPAAKLDVNSDSVILRTAKTPASAGAAGTTGMICWDASYVYVCVATNTWKRSAIATW